jgi:hypothetical protein
MKKEICNKIMYISDEELIKLNDKLLVKRTKLGTNSLSRLFSCIKAEAYARWVSEKESTLFKNNMGL